VSLGFFFVLVGVSRWAVDLPPILLLLTGAWFIYSGIVSIFPTRHYWRYYPQSGLSGKKYHAELDESGFLVVGDACTSRVLWTEVLLDGEDKHVFIFCAKGTIFIFGKKYLTDEQQKTIRRFATLR
jgi:hypothetical protein